jgi:hypothetical protein
MESPNKLGIDLRERLPLPHNILSKTDLAGQSWCGAACGYTYHRGCGQCIHNSKDETYYLDYYVSARDSAESGKGFIDNRYLNYFIESINMNVGGLYRDVKVSSLPMTGISVGAVIVVGGWESQPQGEGRQEVNIFPAIPGLQSIILLFK